MEKCKLKKFIKDKSGSAYIEMVIGILVFTLAVAFIVKFVPVLILKNQLNSFTTSVSRIISVEGSYDSTVEGIVEELRQKSEIGAVTISTSGTSFISGTKKIQLNGTINITVTTQYDIGFFTFGSFPITVNSKAQARSEVYWK